MTTPVLEPTSCDCDCCRRWQEWAEQFRRPSLADRASRPAAPEETEGCPCATGFVESCTPNCSCKDQFLSGGCLRCCRYGSEEQRRAAAYRLAHGGRCHACSLSVRSCDDIERSSEPLGCAGFKARRAAPVPGEWPK